MSPQKQHGLIVAVLVAILCYELHHFALLDRVCERVIELKESGVIKSILLWSLVISFCGLLVLLGLRNRILQDKISFSFAQKKSRNEFEMEMRKETHRQVEALINSAEYQLHRTKFSNSEKFIETRYADSQEEKDDSILLTSSDDEDNNNYDSSRLSGELGINSYRE